MNAPTIPPTRHTQPDILSASIAKSLPLGLVRKRAESICLISLFQNELEDCLPYLDLVAMMEDLPANRLSIQDSAVGAV